MGQYLQRNEQTPSVSTLTKVGFVFFFLKKISFCPLHTGLHTGQTQKST